MESPLRTELLLDSCSERHQGNCCASTREFPATWITQGAERCSCDSTAAFARHRHTWISLSVRKETSSGEETAAFSRRKHTWIFFCAQTDMFMRQTVVLSRHKHTWISLCAQTDMFIRQTAAFSRHKHTWISFRVQGDMFRQNDCCVLTPQAHLDLFLCANRHVHATTLLRSHAKSTLGFHSVRKETCSGKTTAAFSRHEHTWISLRAPKGMSHRKDCCVLTPQAHLDLFLCANRYVHATHCCVLTSQAHLDLTPCARRHVPAKRLLRSHAASTLGSLSVRKETCAIEKTAAISCCPQDRLFQLAEPRSSFYSQARTRPLRYREPVTRNPGRRAFALQIVDPMSVYAVGEFQDILSLNYTLKPMKESLYVC